MQSSQYNRNPPAMNPAYSPHRVPSSSPTQAQQPAAGSHQDFQSHSNSYSFDSPSSSNNNSNVQSNSTSYPDYTVPAFSSPEPEIHYTAQDETDTQLSSPGAVNHAQAQNNTQDPKTERRLLRRQVGGAAAAAGVAGLVVVGPIVGVLAAGGAAAGAALGKGPGGKIARGTGEVVANAGDRLKKIDNKHQVVKKTTTGVSKGYKWVSSKVRRNNGNLSNNV